MLSNDELKYWLHQKSLKPLDKILLTLATFEQPCQIADLKLKSLNAGLKFPKTWNVSTYLKRSNGYAINLPNGWEITDVGKQHLHSIGITKISAAAFQIATDLRSLLENVSDKDLHSFVDESIKCYEAGLYRSSIVMSWLASVYVLHNYVFRNHLKAFNIEAKRVDNDWKIAKTLDDLGKMNESQFLDRIASISVIGKNVKEELQKCLKLRNGCGHPNSLKVSVNMAASHIETLLLNVFNVYL